VGRKEGAAARWHSTGFGRCCLPGASTAGRICSLPAVAVTPCPPPHPYTPAPSRQEVVLWFLGIQPRLKCVALQVPPRV
jgi:hypothetical protein